MHSSLTPKTNCGKTIPKLIHISFIFVYLIARRSRNANKRTTLMLLHKYMWIFVVRKDKYTINTVRKRQFRLSKRQSEGTVRKDGVKKNLNDCAQRVQQETYSKKIAIARYEKDFQKISSDVKNIVLSIEKLYRIDPISYISKLLKFNKKKRNHKYFQNRAISTTKKPSWRKTWKKQHGYKRTGHINNF